MIRKWVPRGTLSPSFKVVKVLLGVFLYFSLQSGSLSDINLVRKQDLVFCLEVTHIFSGFHQASSLWIIFVWRKTLFCHVYALILHCAIMGKSDISLVKFNGTNYTSWAFQFRIYLKGKELWAHVDGFDPKPNNDTKAVVKWEVKDA